MIAAHPKLRTAIGRINSLLIIPVEGVAEWTLDTHGAEVMSLGGLLVGFSSSRKRLAVKARRWRPWWSHKRGLSPRLMMGGPWVIYQ
jgi:hypothetical protein